jgi:hypothetical protein
MSKTTFDTPVVLTPDQLRQMISGDKPAVIYGFDAEEGKVQFSHAAERRDDGTFEPLTAEQAIETGGDDAVAWLTPSGSLEREDSAIH